MRGVSLEVDGPARPLFRELNIERPPVILAVQKS
jgi:hypothetical protein